MLADKRNADTDLPYDYLRFADGSGVRHIRITAEELPYGKKFALSGLRVFGTGNGQKPAAVTGVTAARTDDRTAAVSWEKCADATGYNVRFGIAPEKLYSSYQLYESTDVQLTVLNKCQQYYVCDGPSTRSDAVSTIQYHCA